jgi:serine protease Do
MLRDGFSSFGLVMAYRRGKWVALGAMLVLALPVAGRADQTKIDGTKIDKGFAELAARLLPAVVNISTSATVKPGAEDTPDLPQFPPGSPFEQFFKDFMNRQGGGGSGGQAKPEKETALGSGFIIDPAGLVVTNNHVIADADSITVILQDNSRVKAVVVGHDPLTDLALLRIKPPHKLVAVPFGDSDTVRVGDWVVAVGNPYGLGGTVTAGILSARARAISDDGPYDDFLQTDAAINKGNSGGPLFDLKGEVIGINSAIFSPSGGSVGIGFAIPSDLVQHVVQQFRTIGKVRRGWIGVRLQSVSAEIAEALDLPDGSRGGLIGALVPGSPAQVAGLKPGDVIQTVAGHPIHDARAVERAVGDADVGQPVAVGVWRKGKPKTIQVAVIEQPAQPAPQNQGVDDTPPAQTVTLFGMTLSQPTPALKDKYQFGDAATVVVTGVAKKGTSIPAPDVQPGDVIVEAGGIDLDGPADLLAKVAERRKTGHRSLLLLVDRKGDLHYVALRIDQG